MSRKSFLKIILLPISFLMMIPGLGAQETVTLYLEADTSGHVVYTLPADDPRLESAAAMGFDSDQPIIWKMFELEDTFEGYVLKTAITKGMTVASGALVYFIPGDENTFLAILEEGNEAQVLSVEDDWARISVPTSLPVYFQSKAPEKEPATTEVAGELDLPSPSPITVEGALATGRAANLPPPPSGTVSGLPLDRKLEGRLRQVSQSGLFSRPKYDWELVDSKNRRIAYVDTKNLILSSPMQSLAGRRVILSGTLSELGDGRNMLLVARQIVTQGP